MLVCGYTRGFKVLHQHRNHISCVINHALSLRKGKVKGRSFPYRLCRELSPTESIQTKSLLVNRTQNGTQPSKLCFGLEAQIATATPAPHQGHVSGAEKAQGLMKSWTMQLNRQGGVITEGSEVR